MRVAQALLITTREIHYCKLDSVPFSTHSNPPLPFHFLPLNLACLTICDPSCKKMLLNHEYVEYSG